MKSLIVGLSAMLLVGCITTSRPKYSINPAVEASVATVIFKTSGIAAPVWFGISHATKDCDSFSSVGYVYDHQRDKSPVLSATKKLLRTLEFDGLDEIKEIRMSVPSGKSTQVQGYGNDSSSRMINTCGPITSRFTPRQGGRYVVTFAWDGMCSMTVQDVTGGDTPSAVTVRSYMHCEWED